MKDNLRKVCAIGLIGGISLLASCISTEKRLLDSDTSQVQLRSIQERTFETTDRERALRAVMATLQDLSFIIDSADLGLGTVSGSKWDRVPMRITVAVWPRGETRMLVRASCQVERKPVQDPIPYQRFFAALSKALFLEAHEVE